MNSLPLLVAVALSASVLLLMAMSALRRRRRPVRQRSSVPRDAVDTVAGWPPGAVRVMSIAEREAYDLLKRAMPGFPVLAQVPLTRFIRVASQRPHADWLQRVGPLSADLLLCDAGSRVLAVIDIRATEESERSRKRHERMARVLRAAAIPVHTWRENQMPSLAQVRHSLAPLAGLAAPRARAGTTQSLSALPMPEVSEILAEGDRAALEAALDKSMEPVPSAFFDDLEPAAAR